MRHVLIKLSKIKCKEKILKATREKRIIKRSSREMLDMIEAGRTKYLSTPNTHPSI